jgi:hypothetical protein
MSDQIKGFVVTLKDNMKDEDAEHIRCAIMLLANVADVGPIKSELGDFVTCNRLRIEIAERVYEAIWGEQK